MRTFVTGRRETGPGALPFLWTRLLLAARACPGQNYEAGRGGTPPFLLSVTLAVKRKGLSSVTLQEVASCCVINTSVESQKCGSDMGSSTN